MRGAVCSARRGGLERCAGARQHQAVGGRWCSRRRSALIAGVERGVGQRHGRSERDRQQDDRVQAAGRVAKGVKGVAAAAAAAAVAAAAAATATAATAATAAAVVVVAAAE